MRRPSILGPVLITVSLIALVSPLPSLIIYLLDLSPPPSLPVPPFVQDHSESSATTTTMTILPSFTLETVLWTTISRLQAIPRVITRWIAGGIVFYIGICVGYVGLVQMGWVVADNWEVVDRKTIGWYWGENWHSMKFINFSHHVNNMRPWDAALVMPWEEGNHWPMYFL